MLANIWLIAEFSIVFIVKSNAYCVFAYIPPFTAREYLKNKLCYMLKKFLKIATAIHSTMSPSHLTNLFTIRHSSYNVYVFMARIVWFCQQRPDRSIHDLPQGNTNLFASVIECILTLIKMKPPKVKEMPKITLLLFSKIAFVDFRLLYSHVTIIREHKTITMAFR